MGKTVLTDKLTTVQGLPATPQSFNSDRMKGSVKGFQVGQCTSKGGHLPIFYPYLTQHMRLNR